MRIANQQEYLKIAREGRDWVELPNGKDCKDALPYLATSNCADAWLIGAWHAYHVGGDVAAIRKSRGHTWLVETRRYDNYRLRIDNPYDHRDGVTVITV